MRAAGFFLFAAALVAPAQLIVAHPQAMGADGQLSFNNACRTCHS